MSGDGHAPHVRAGLGCGAQSVHALMVAAVDGAGALRDATRALTDGQARWALTAFASWDAAQAAGEGVRVVVDDPVLDELRAAASAGFAGVHAAVAALEGPEVRAAVANLAWLLVGLRADAGRAVLN